MSYTPEELEEFINQKDLELIIANNDISIKSNEFQFSKNFQYLNVYLAKLKAFTVYTRKMVNINSIIEQLLPYLQTTKSIIPINHLMQNGEEIYSFINGTNYLVKRIDSYTIEISNITNPEWNVDMLMIQVKNVDGFFVYPVISTVSNKITLTFTDGLLTNYNMFFI
jgi:hypothetical protein